MQPRSTDNGLASFTIETPTTSDTADTDTMGRAYRTPSLKPEEYISSSNVNSPTGTPARVLNSSHEYESYQQHQSNRAFEHAEMESGKRQAASTSYLSNSFGPTSQYVLENNASTLEKNASTLEKSVTASESTIEEPKTPTKKRMQSLWHGLPSPETPTFHGSPSAGSSVGTVGSGYRGGHKYQLRHLFPRTSEYLGEDASTDRVQVAFHELRRSPAEPRGNTQATALQVNDDTDTEAPDDVTIRDTMLARELEVELSPSTTRRSARLRTVPKPSYSLLPPVVARTVRNKPAVLDQKQGTPAQPELTIVACKSDPIPFEGLPTVHSLSWQLQYPPGGSTHPSYPYPVMDPRLIFHQLFVPMTNGLPDFSRVPKLILPMGWQHVSWAGLLPIAFDPYRQAFKLTPVGPMPLTCEELHQGGLHKYVPGGELHPEFGMLPEMLKLSDGSDAEVFDFEGVDWTLPWEGHMEFHAPTASATGFQHTITGALTPSSTSTAPITVVVYPWSEARDCPNQIYDLSDAWRWLAAKEVNATTDFVPTPKKKWHGTGAIRSTRKLKAPIPELMMGAKSRNPDSPIEAPNTNPLLQNQDRSAEGSKNLFCPFKSVATSLHVDITLLGDTEFTIMELLSYFPQHLNWGHAADRLAKAGLGPAAIRDIVNMARLLEGDSALNDGTISNAINLAKRRDLAKPEEIDIDEVGEDTPTPAPKSEVVDMTAAYTAKGWVYDVRDKIDYPLLALAHGLQTLPSGPDAGPLTALILWCREQKRYQVLISEVPALLKEADIEPLIEAGEAGCPDKELITRHGAAMKKDRFRVLKSAGERKRALDAKDESKGKRMKAAEHEERYRR